MFLRRAVVAGGRRLTSDSFLAVKLWLDVWKLNLEAVILLADGHC
jgi:hypothetical protein